MGECRIIVALGKKYVGDINNIDPYYEDIVIVGSSSDHLILDVSSSKKDSDIGDILNFHVKYPAMLYATTYNCVHREYINKKNLLHLFYSKEDL